MRAINTFLVMLLATFSIQSFAYDFEVDGIYYKVQSMSDLTCEVTFGENKYVGDVVIPEIVTLQKREFTVVGVDAAFDGCVSLTSVSLPYTIKSISNRAFAGCVGLTSIDLPSGITSIGDNVFQGCIKLKEIVIPENVVSIGNSSYAGCINLTDIQIPSSVTNIGNNAFDGCTNLNNIELPNHLTYLGEGAFNGCKAISLVQLPTTLKTLEENTFAGCSNIANISIPANITSIKNGCFSGCTSLKSLIIEDSGNPIEVGNNREYYSGNNSFGTALFEDCPLQQVYLGRNIDYRDFWNYYVSPFANKTQINNMVLGHYFTKIKGKLFKGLSNIQEIIIPNSVEFISDQAFYNCGIKKLVFEEGETAITLELEVSTWSVQCPQTFRGCPVEEVKYGRTLVISGGSQNPGYHGSSESFFSTNSLKRVEIGEDVSNIDLLLYNNEKKTTSLKHYKNLEQITFGSNYLDLPDLSENSTLNTICLTAMTPPKAYAFTNAQYINMSVFVPTDSKSTYENANIWKNFWNIEEREGLLRTIEVDGLRYRIVNDMSVRVIKEANSYSGDIIVPDKILIGNNEYRVESIGDAFCGCSSLQSVVLGANIVEIPNSAFQNCTSLVSVQTNGVLTSIGQYAFDGCVKLESIPMNESLKSIGSYAFRGCTAITNVKLPNSLELIMNNAFEGCFSIAEIKLNKQLISIGTGAFAECTSLKSITIPEKVGFIPSNLFSGCTSLEIVNIEDGIGYIDDYAFTNCKSLCSLDLPSTVRWIGGDVFSDCEQLETVNLNNGLTEIKSYAFRNCKGLQHLIIPSSVNMIGNEAFNGCKSLSKIVFEDNEEPINLGGYENSFTSYGPETTTDGNEIVYRFIRFYHGLFYQVPLKDLYLGRDLQYKHYERTNGMYSQRNATYDNKYDSPFYEISTLQNITIGAKVNHLGEDVIYIEDWGKTVTPDLFIGCANIKLIESWNESAPKHVMFDNNVYKNAVLYISEGAKISYSTTEGWKDFNYMYEDTHNFISKQPTANDLSVELAQKDDGAKYQWLKETKQNMETVTTPIIGAIEPHFTNDLNDFKDGDVIFCEVTLSSGRKIQSERVALINSGIEDINCDLTSGYTVYSLNGICVVKTMNRSELRKLPRGIYIVNGKKVMVK